MDNDEEEIDIINYDDISSITSGQILTCDYTVHPKWNENAEGENFWSDSVPKNENINLEQNVEVLHSEEIVIEEPEPVAPISWSEEVADVVFEDDIPITEEIVIQAYDENEYKGKVDENENESILEEEIITNNDWINEPTEYETHLISEKYITPTNSRSLLKKTKIMDAIMHNSRSLLKTNHIQNEKPIRKFKKTLTLETNLLPIRKNLNICSNPLTNSKAKFIQTVKLNKDDFEQEGFKLHGRKIRQRKLNKNLISQKLDKNFNQIKNKSNNFKTSIQSETIIKIQKSDSDIEIDIEGEIDFQTDKLSIINNNQKEKYKTATKSEINSNNVCNISTNLELQLRDLSTPIYETHLNPAEISDLEKYFHKEFFEGRSTKTPEQYLRIRNHILTQWNSSNGKSYVSKTSVRGLKHGGDVNCISRIHRLLEQLGAINFGFQSKNFEYVRPLEDYMGMFVAQTRPQTNIQQHIIPLTGRRQRTKTSSFSFNNCDQNPEDINYTIHHLDNVHKPEVPALNKKEPVFEKRKHIQNELDLVKCLKFPNSELAPFKVSITLSTLLCLHMHALSSNHEIMGFLGGQITKSTVGKNRINIIRYKPCKTSEQSDTSCEMDPVSQVEQSGSLKSEGYDLLGWFHSHPKFKANPSQTDIITQKNMQLQFSMQTDRPFVGFILSCINMDLKCMYIIPNDLQSKEISNGLTYELEINIIRDLKNIKYHFRDLLSTIKTNTINSYVYEKVIEKFKASSESTLQKMGLSHKNIFDEIF